MVVREDIIVDARRRIVFVDDEMAILQGLNRVLCDMRDEWETSFFTCALEAQQFMDAVECDVIVADFRMRGMDGIALLCWVRDHHPAMVRIILTGHSDLNAVLRAIPVAHTFMSKPCRPEALVRILRRSCAIQSLLDDADLRRLVGRIGTLPINPAAYSRLTAALSDERTDVSDVSAIVCADLALCTKVLHLANNAFFGLPRNFVTVEQAVAFIGMRTLRKLVLSAEVFAAWDARLPKGDRSVGLAQRHGMACGRIAAALARDDQLATYSLSAGLLHDVGKLISTAETKDSTFEAENRSTVEQASLHDVNGQNTSTMHARVGAYLLGLWGIQYPILEAVAHHHDPASVRSSEFDVPTIVHIADALAHELENESAGFRGESMLDMSHLEKIGVLEELSGMRALSRKVMSESQ